MEPIMQQLAVSKEGCKPQVYNQVGGKVMAQNVQNCYYQQQPNFVNMSSNNMAVNQMINQVRQQKHN
jgi:hypothetical protein